GTSFNQPEGIAFDRDNNLYISNEGGDLSAGNILMFKLKK
ncbi:MAG: SdiA-regulated family protein, partial [Pedobacter sp.]